jgi:hypothetical protein
LTGPCAFQFTAEELTTDVREIKMHTNRPPPSIVADMLEHCGRERFFKNAPCAGGAG